MADHPVLDNVVSDSAVTVVIPAYNEERNIGMTVQALRTARLIRDIIVVDDASFDDTAAKAKEAGAKVIILARNAGKGRAVMAAFPHIETELILLLDADLRESACKALTLVEPVMENKADLAVAKFPRNQSIGGFGIVRNFSCLATKLLTGKLLEAPLSGQRCLKKQTLAALLPLGERFGLEIGMNIDALRLGYKLVEVETGLTHCPPGRDSAGFVHRGAQLLDVLRVLFGKIQGEKVSRR